MVFSCRILIFRKCIFTMDAIRTGFTSSQKRACEENYNKLPKKICTKEFFTRPADENDLKNAKHLCIRQNSNIPEQDSAKKLKLSNESSSVLFDAVVYPSFGNDNICINVTYDDKYGKKITCRHLAYFFLSCLFDSEKENNAESRNNKIKEYHFILNKMMKENVFPEELKGNFFDRREIEKNNGKEYTHLDKAGFNRFLYGKFKKLKLGECSYFYLALHTHAVSVVIKRKSFDKKNDESSMDIDGYYVVLFYDPNISLTHKRLVFKNIDFLNNLSVLDYFMQKKDMDTYFSRFKTFLAIEFDDFSWKKYPSKIGLRILYQNEIDMDDKIRFHIEFCGSIKHQLSEIKGYGKSEIKYIMKFILDKSELYIKTEPIFEFMNFLSTVDKSIISLDNKNDMRKECLERLNTISGLM